ncbi:hypothetical protein ACHAQH_003375 [Verticillium albo-atrum]
MEGYDMKPIGSLNAQPAFNKRYGKQLPSGKYEIPAAWQAAFSNSATIGSLIDLGRKDWLLFCRYIPETKGGTYAELNVLFVERTKAWKIAGKQVDTIEEAIVGDKTE